MKKTLFLLISILLTMCVFCSCSSSAVETAEENRVDEKFLADIEASVLDRMEKTKNDGYDLKELVNKELAYLKEYGTATFADERLSELATKYLEGLSLQKEALAAAYEWESQVEWQRGIVFRYEVLCALNEEYDLLSDNKDFIAEYILNYDDQKALLIAYDALEADIGGQFDSESFSNYWSGQNCCFDLWNHTEYQFSAVFDIQFYDESGNLFDQQQCYVEDVRPNSGYVISVYLEEPWKMERGEINNYYTDVVY